MPASSGALCSFLSLNEFAGVSITCFWLKPQVRRHIGPWGENTCCCLGHGAKHTECKSSRWLSQWINAAWRSALSVPSNSPVGWFWQLHWKASKYLTAPSRGWSRCHGVMTSRPWENASNFYILQTTLFLMEAKLFPKVLRSWSMKF